MDDRDYTVVSGFTRRLNREGLSQGGKMRHDRATYARSIAKSWPELSDEKQDEIAEILAPVIAEKVGRFLAALPDDAQLAIIRRALPPVVEGAR